MLEHIIMVDENDNELGSIEKMEAHHKAILHRAFSILVFNSKGQLLLQKRSQSKYHTPGLWTNTCCSHPRYRETLQDAVNRRLQEEMGFSCELQEMFSFLYKIEFEEQLYEHEYDHVFFGVYDGEVYINQEEVDDYRWMSMDEIRDDISLHPEIYTYWFKFLFERAHREFATFVKTLK